MRRRRAAALLLGLGAVSSLVAAGPAAALGPASFSIPSSAQQLIVVSSPTSHPSRSLARFQTFERANASAPWKPRFATWRAEIGSGDLVNIRHFGDHATPTGVFAIGLRMYGIEPDPGGLHYAYHQLTCGDWWDEDPYSAQYNRFVHVPCGATPSFASWSEALWTETRAYPYFAVLETNNDPTIGGANAPGAGIFLHHWMNAPTEGCVALPLADLLKVLRWLLPAAHPVIEIGTGAQVGAVASPREADGGHHRPAAARAVHPRRRVRGDRRVAVAHAVRRGAGAHSRRTREGGVSLIAGGSLAALGVAVALCVVLALRAGRARGTA